MKDEKEIKIKFNDLSFPLKILIVLGWIFTGFALIQFIIGFILGTMMVL